MLLRTSPRWSGSENYPRGAAVYAVQVLDYLYQHSTSSYHLALITRVLDFAGYGHPVSFSLDWLVEGWVDETVRQPFDAAGGLPPGFTEQWQPRGQVTSTDLDDNGDPDYLLTVRFGPPDDVSRAQGLYWLYRKDGQFQVELLESTGVVSRIKVRDTRDLNDDGHTDLAYSVTWLGAHTTNEYLRLRTRQNDTWRVLPLIPEDWTPSNSNWVIKSTENGPAELIVTDGGAGSAGFAPIVPYQIHFRWVHGEFIPVDISPARPREQWGEDVAWLGWAQRLAYARHLAEALDVLTALLNRPSPPHPSGVEPTPSYPSPAYPSQVDSTLSYSQRIDYTPYTLYRIGMTHLLLGDVASAQKMWEQLTTRFPDLPISRDVSQLCALDPLDAWRACAWLRQHNPDWIPPGMGGGRTGNATPLYYGSYGCDYCLLVPLATWKRREPIEAQAARLGLAWKLLTADYDLNQDSIPDPIGALDGLPWAFLSDQDGYRPLYVAQPFPPEAINLMYVYDVTEPGDTPPIVTDLDGNHRPEVLMCYSHRFLLFEWIGHRFLPHDVGYWDWLGQVSVEKDAIRVALFNSQTPTQQVGEWVYRLEKGELIRVSPPPEESTPSPLSQALEALFRARDPRRALTVLDGFQSTDSWEQAAAHCLRALAFEYTGGAAMAQDEFSIVVREFPDTSWALIAAERLAEVSP